MEPQCLEQLLDCPICFERLDGSNRVLPCQHTFCKKCLEKVKSRFKELRCPECRTKYTGSINDLNCNILVMRILEQIKQSEKETQMSKNASNHVKYFNGKTETKSPALNIDGKNQVIVSSKSPFSAFFNNNSGTSYVRYRTSRNCAETGAVAQQTPSSNNEIRNIIGATRKQNRNDDGTRSSSIFCRPAIPSSTSSETATHSVRGNEGLSFSPNSYTFTVELKSSDRNSVGNRRANKNYVKPSILNSASNLNVIRSSGNLFDTLEAATTTNSSVMTSSASPSVSVFQSVPKNYLSFNPGSYTFNVNLKSGAHKKKNYLS